MAFYVLLSPVHRDLALLSAFFGLVSMCLFAFTKMFYFAAPMFVDSSGYLTVFSPQQLDGLASVFLWLYAGLSGLSMLFYGTAWVIRGYLTWRSGYLPRFLGGAYGGGRGRICNKEYHVRTRPGLSAQILLAPMFFNMLVVAIWLLVKGVDRNEWERRGGGAKSNVRLHE